MFSLTCLEYNVSGVTMLHPVHGVEPGGCGVGEQSWCFAVLHDRVLAGEPGEVVVVVGVVGGHRLVSFTTVRVAGETSQ